LATNVQRALAILNALADPAVIGAPMALRVANAYTAIYAPGHDGPGMLPLTNEEKAGLFLLHVRNRVKQVVREAELKAAADAAIKATAPTTEIDIGVDGALYVPPVTPP